jgi:hypothetical protein
MSPSQICESDQKDVSHLSQVSRSDAVGICGLSSRDRQILMCHAAYFCVTLVTDDFAMCHAVDTLIYWLATHVTLVTHHLGRCRKISAHSSPAGNALPKSGLAF